MQASARRPATAPVDRWATATAALVRASFDGAGTVLAAYALLLTLAVAAIATHLRVDADPAALMADELPWRRAALEHERAFPDLHRQIVAVFDADTEDARRLLAELHGWLADAPLRAIVAPQLDSFFERHGLLYLDLPQLEALAADLDAAQPLLGRIARDPTVAGLCRTLLALLDHADALPPERVERFVDAMARSVASAAGERQTALEWTQLAMGTAESPRRQFISFLPRDRSSEDEALRAVRAAVAQLGAQWPKVRLTGEITEWDDELSAAADGALLSAALSLALVTLLLRVGLHSWRLAAIALAALVCGLMLTAAAAALAVGRLNLISIAFAALYIGLAIDFSVHLLLRWRELRLSGADARDAAAAAGRDVGGALLLCALTTAAGFYAFVPTAFRGVSELGLISGTGILIGLLTSLTLLPALLRCAGPMQADALQMPAVLLDWPHRRRAAVLAAAAACAAAAALALPLLRFDYNPMHLRPPDTDSQRIYEELVHGADTPLTAVVLAADAAATQEQAERLGQLPVVREARWLGSLLPQDQDAKLEVIADLALSAGAALPAALKLGAADVSRDRAALQALAERIGAMDAPPPAWQRLGEAIDRWLAAPGDANVLRDQLLGGLPGLLARLHASLQAQPVTADALPADLRAQWRSADGRYRIELVPAQNLDDDEALRRFADTVAAAAPDASGAPLEYVAGARTVQRAFAQAFIAAAVAIAVLLPLLLRSFADSLRAAAPLALGALLTAGLCAAIDLPLNFANIIALPLLLGAGLDNGVHLIWRARHAGGSPLAGSTGRAVLVAVLTTLSSFASLAFSPHRGMASLGLMLTLGLSIMLACSFLVLPALLKPRP
ncbi:MMPL family transporter [Fontimonas sp. SYSU GA230001]|uniref:MMPL family transporter n=1 Tax=Fontimonas sp. SYSU GA230001 TaxID=3142450 RepID=UPI0032B46AF9